MVNKVEVQSNEARQRILAAARAEFAEKGFDGARVDAIALRAQVNKALIYYYFKSKDKLLQELLHQFQQDRMRLRTHLEYDPVQRDLPNRIARSDVDFLFSQRDILRVALMEDLKSPPQGRALLKHWVEGLEVVRTAYAQHGYHYRYTPRVLAATFFYQLMPTVAFATLGEALARETDLDIETLRKEFLQLVGETSQRHADTVFARSCQDPAPEVKLPKPASAAKGPEDKNVPAHLAVSAEEKAALVAKYIVNGRMVKFPLKEKAKVALLEYFSGLFDVRKTYSEKQVNEILKPIAEDYVKVRRYLLEYGYLGRRPDGSAYWSRS
jgi:AcrR family transcriptional regulator